MSFLNGSIVSCTRASSQSPSSLNFKSGVHLLGCGHMLKIIFQESVSLYAFFHTCTCVEKKLYGKGSQYEYSMNPVLKFITVFEIRRTG